MIQFTGIGIGDLHSHKQQEDPSSKSAWYTGSIDDEGKCDLRVSSYNHMCKRGSQAWSAHAVEKPICTFIAASHSNTDTNTQVTWSTNPFPLFLTLWINAYWHKQPHKQRQKKRVNESDSASLWTSVRTITLTQMKARETQVLLRAKANVRTWLLRNITQRCNEAVSLLDDVSLPHFYV